MVLQFDSNDGSLLNLKPDFLFNPYSRTFHKNFDVVGGVKSHQFHKILLQACLLKKLLDLIITLLH